MASALSPAQVLAEHLLGRSVHAYIAEKRSARPRWSWKLIAEQLAEDTDGKVDVTAETVRVWFVELDMPQQVSA